MEVARPFVPRPPSKKKRVYGRNMVPPVRSRAARAAVPPGVSAETPAIEKGSWQGRQALTEGLWVSCRNGHPITGRLLLHRAYNPSASHSLSTSPYTGEARGDGRLLATRRFAGRQGVGGRCPLAPLCREARGGGSLPKLYDNSTSDSPSTPSSRRLSRVRELIWEI